jgi:hypothetical protein
MAFEGKKKFLIAGVQIGEFKGNKTISIPFGKPEEDGRQEAFSFGVVKARGICKNIDAIMKFVEDSDKEYEAKKAARPAGSQATW